MERLRERRLQWIGHVERIKYRLTVRKYRRQTKQTQRKRWIDSVNEDLTELGSSILKARNLLKDRQTWRSVIDQPHRQTLAGEWRKARKKKKLFRKQLIGFAVDQKGKISTERSFGTKRWIKFRVSQKLGLKIDMPKLWSQNFGVIYGKSLRVNFFKILDMRKVFLKFNSIFGRANICFGNKMEGLQHSQILEDRNLVLRSGFLMYLPATFLIGSRLRFLGQISVH